VVTWFSFKYLYVFKRTPVLEDIWRHWPVALDGWFLNISQRIDLARRDVIELEQLQHPLNQRIRLLFPHERLGRRVRSGRKANIFNRTIPLNYGVGLRWLFGFLSYVSLGSLTLVRYRFVAPPKRQPAFLESDLPGDIKPQKVFLRAAAMERFQNKSSIHVSARFVNWLIYWCFPSWIGFLILLLPLFRCFLFNIPLSINDERHLILAAASWVTVSSIFLWRQLRFISNHQWVITQQEVESLPVGIHRYIVRSSRVTQLLANFQAKIIFAIVYAAAFTLYLQLLPLAIQKEPVSSGLQVMNVQVLPVNFIISK
jgi:hypothetical protein